MPPTATCNLNKFLWFSCFSVPRAVLSRGQYARKAIWCFCPLARREPAELLKEGLTGFACQSGKHMASSPKPHLFDTLQAQRLQHTLDIMIGPEQFGMLYSVFLFCSEECIYLSDAIGDNYRLHNEPSFCSVSFGQLDLICCYLENRLQCG